MKKKTVFSLFLAFLLIFTLSFSAFAADDGRQVTRAGETYTVFPNGTCQAALGEKEIAWVCAENMGKSMWIGIQNGEGLFEKDSLFHVKILTKSQDPEEYQRCLDRMDVSGKKETGNASFLLVGVTSPDGTEYTALSQPAQLYFELSSGFDREDAKALFLSDGMDENIRSEFSVMNGPEGKGEFAILHFPHFGMPVAFQNGSSLFLASVFGENNLWIIGLLGAAVLTAAVLIVKKKKA